MWRRRRQRWRQWRRRQNEAQDGEKKTAHLVLLQFGLQMVNNVLLLIVVEPSLLLAEAQNTKTQPRLQSTHPCLLPGIKPAQAQSSAVLTTEVVDEPQL